MWIFEANIQYSSNDDDDEDDDEDDVNDNSLILQSEWAAV